MTQSTSIQTGERPSLPDQFLEPFHRLRSELDKVFDEFPDRWPSIHLPTRFNAVSAAPVPAVEMTEKPDSYVISVEVPGIEPESIDLQIDGNALILKGEKHSEREEQEEDYTFSERSYGAFERRIVLPADCAKDKVEAKAKNGVLKITLPREGRPEASARKIEIESAKGG